MGEQTSMDFSSTSLILVCVKWVAARLEIDPVNGSVTHQPHDAWFSTADMAAVETALLLADDRAGDGAVGGLYGSRPEVVAICVGPGAADDYLRDLIASGVDRVIRIDSGPRTDPSDQPTSARVATAIAETINSVVTAAGAGIGAGAGTEAGVTRNGDAMADPVVLCGDASADRGSGSVPAFVADELGFSQALGLVEVSSSDGTLRCVRRLDGGRREVLSVTGPAVISVEGSVARLRRASLAAMVTSRGATIDVRHAELPTDSERPILSPYRPRTRVVDAPAGEHALERIEALTGARTDRTPPRTITAEPHEAARAILDQLREWGYEWRTD